MQIPRFWRFALLIALAGGVIFFLTYATEAEKLSKATITLGFFFLGVLLGNFYVFSGYGLSNGEKTLNRDSGEIQKSPRIKNLQYLLSGAVAALLINWRPFAGEQFSSSNVFAAYLFGSILGASISLYYVKRSIEKQISEINTSRRSVPFISPRQMVLDYFHYGYHAFSESLEKYDEIESILTYHEEFFEQIADIQARTQAHLAAFTQLKEIPEEEREYRKDDIENEIIATIKQMVNLYAQDDLGVKINCTILIYQSNTPCLSRILFVETEEQRQGLNGCLAFRKRPRGSEAPLFVPVPKSHDNGEFLLPGAPEAFVNQNYASFNTRDLKFNDSVPEAVRVKVVAYFTMPIFGWVQSVTCIPFGRVSDPSERSGVINLESDRPFLVGEEARLEHLIRAIQPLTFMLGRVS